MKNSMRKLSVVLVTILILIGTFPAIAGPPAGEWTSYVVCQNTGSGDATITFKLYEQGSSTETATYTDPTALPAGRSRVYYTPDTFPGLVDFIGSSVVSSTQPLVCTVNTRTTGTGTIDNFFRIGGSEGFSANTAAPTMFAPQIEKNFYNWNSYISVQNVNSSAVDVTLNYKDRNGNSLLTATETATIPANSNKIFYQNDNANLLDGFVGSAVVSANDGTSNLAIVVNQYNDGASYETAQMLSYSGYSTGASKLFVPRIVLAYYSYNSGITIQNLGASATTVRITYNFNGVAYTQDSPSINPGAAWAIYLPDVTELDPVESIPNNLRYGNAIIDVLTGGPIVANVNTDNRGGSGVPTERIGQGATYGAFIDGTLSNKVHFPQVPSNVDSTISGGFQIANVTNTATTCDIVYNGDTDANETGVALPAYGSIGRFGPDVPNLNDGYDEGVTVTCGTTIAGIQNAAVIVGSGLYGDSYTINNGQ